MNIVCEWRFSSETGIDFTNLTATWLLAVFPQNYWNLQFWNDSPTTTKTIEMQYIWNSRWIDNFNCYIVLEREKHTAFGWWHAFLPLKWEKNKFKIQNADIENVCMFRHSSRRYHECFVFIFSNLRTTRHATALHSDVCRPTFETWVRELEIQIVTSCTSVDYIFFQSSYNRRYNVYAKYARHCGC